MALYQESVVVSLWICVDGCAMFDSGDSIMVPADTNLTLIPIYDVLSQPPSIIWLCMHHHIYSYNMAVRVTICDIITGQLLAIHGQYI